MTSAGFPTVQGVQSGQCASSGEEDSVSIEDKEETALECQYTTPLDIETSEGYVDEFAVFIGLLDALQSTSAPIYNQMINLLTEKQKKQLNDIFVYNGQRKAAAESAKISQQGGYQFNANQVPQNFNFGAQNGTFAPPNQ